MLAVRETVLKALEEARNQKLIGGNLQAQVTLTAADPVFSVLERFKNDLRYFFIVSAVEVKKGSGNGDSPVVVQVEQSSGAEVRALLEFLDSRGRGQELSHGVRALQRRAQRNWRGVTAASANAISYR